MLDVLPRVRQQAFGFWGRLTGAQRWSLGGALVVAVVAAGLIGASREGGPLSTGVRMVPLINAPVEDAGQLLRIAGRLDQERVEYEIRAGDRIFVADQDSARRLRAILIREDLIPAHTDPYSVFDLGRFSVTDFERSVNLQRALTRSLEQHIEALDDVAAAHVTLVVPERELFAEDQLPTTASIVITPRPGSEILDDHQRVLGIQRLVQFAVAGLSAEHIVILDPRGVQVNDPGGLSGRSRMNLVERQLDTKYGLEQRYTREIVTALGNIFSADRVQIVRLDIDLDLSAQSTTTEEHFPIALREDDPLTDTDESLLVASISVAEDEVSETRSSSDGAASENYERRSISRSEVVNRRNTVREESPWAINRITVSVALDGVWRTEFRPDGGVALNPDGSVRRTYTPVPGDELRKATLLVQDAIGWDRQRGDSVTVEHLQFDRSSQFEREDALLRREAWLLSMLPVAAAVTAVLLLLALVVVLRRRQRRRRAERAAGGTARLSSATRVFGTAAPGGLADREMRRNAEHLARRRPQDAARALRRWLVED
ncbi:MAG: flagellar basal-body MS-ring/collar protein FliF [Spirochaetaceae bacterium]|nr:flagellar basal-body MS-ring/collar protein FliF [Spirochaetaceae bacterium]